ncbi:MAG: hypothetical protein K8H88_23380 [Sandaracinaceae bacterium]|nr:hypothetical protein [Sandaracinaceae bacterium]
MVNKKDFVFSSLKASEDQEMVVAERVDVSQWTEATLMVRVHTASTIPGTASVKVLAYADGYTEEDPTTVFQAATASATVLLQGNPVVAAGTFSLALLDDAPIGSMVRVTVKGHQAATVGTVKANISVDLALKD